MNTNKFRLGVMYVFLLVLVLVYSKAQGAEILFIYKDGNRSSLEKQLKTACMFYGLEIERLQIENGNFLKEFSGLKTNGIHAIVIDGHILAEIKDVHWQKLFERRFKNSVPILIANVPATIEPEILKECSKGGVQECSAKSNNSLNNSLRVTHSRQIAQELSGQILPISIGRSPLLTVKNLTGTEIIIGRDDKSDKEFSATFVKSTVDQREIFFLTEIDSLDYEGSMKDSETVEVWKLVPLLMFLRYACGERCWHTDGSYANLTIDDPWLIEPYGFLSYRNLLQEMEKANFHTTIAFIPWNYDRSKPEISLLIRSNPNRFSISIHGNNHDRKEFYQNQKIEKQEEKIEQSLLRMNKFKELTGIPYDRIMIFPHGIAPKSTLNLLKKYNLIATVNSRNIPDGEAYEDLLHQMRPMSVRFNDVPSLKRYSPRARSEAEIALELFLGNPLLFFTHHNYFSEGIDAFNKTAKMVGRIQPNIRWRSLGHIAQHLYVKRKKQHGNVEVEAFSSDVTIANKENYSEPFLIQRRESFSLPIKNVSVDGEGSLYEENENSILLRIVIPNGKSRRVVVEYRYGNANSAALHNLKGDYRVWVLRKLCDFRDLILPKYRAGHIFRNIYYNSPALMGWRIIMIFGVLIGLIVWRKYFRN